jgi:hypothetical protein
MVPPILISLGLDCLPAGESGSLALFIPANDDDAEEAGELRGNRLKFFDGSSGIPVWLVATSTRGFTGGGGE